MVKKSNVEFSILVTSRPDIPLVGWCRREVWYTSGWLVEERSANTNGWLVEEVWYTSGWLVEERSAIPMVGCRREVWYTDGWPEEAWEPFSSLILDRPVPMVGW